MRLLYHSKNNTKTLLLKWFSFPAFCFVFGNCLLINLNQIFIIKPFDFESFSCPAGSPLWVSFCVSLHHNCYIKVLLTNHMILKRFRFRQGPLHESVFVFVKVTSFISNSLLANHMSLNRFRPLQGVCFFMSLFNWFISSSF